MARKRNGTIFANNVAQWAGGVVERHEEIVQLAAMKERATRPGPLAPS